MTELSLHGSFVLHWYAVQSWLVPLSYLAGRAALLWLFSLSWFGWLAVIVDSGGCQKFGLWLGMTGWFFPLHGWAVSACMNSCPLCCVVLPWLDAGLDMHGFCLILAPALINAAFGYSIWFWLSPGHMLLANVILTPAWTGSWAVGVSLSLWMGDTWCCRFLEVLGWSCFKLKRCRYARSPWHGLAWILASWAWCLLPHSGSLSLL